METGHLDTLIHLCQHLDMTNRELIEAIRRLVHGQELSPLEAQEIIALVLQNMKKEINA